ncbi:MAG: HAD family phosphatase [Candidatus Marsarchaeota archaeon]|nr:HAD family phosphatase [Candidatus Marsarchaeota archaeon]
MVNFYNLSTEYKLFNMIKTIIFDLGGVVVCYKESQYFSFLAKKTGLPATKIKDVFNPLIEKMEEGSLSAKHMEKSVSQKLGIKPSVLEWTAAFERLAKPNKELIKMIRMLRKKYKVALLSNISKDRYISASKKFALKDLFHKRFASCYMHVRKPDAKIYKRVVKSMGIKPEESIFIDNLVENVEGAKKIGIRGVHFTGNKKLNADLRRLGVL